MIMFEIPIRTVSHANEHVHWRKRHARVKDERQATMVCMRQAMRKQGAPRDWPFPLEVRLTRLGAQLLDDDNLPTSMKAIRDQVAAELGLKDDRDARVKWRYAQLRGKPAVLVAIEKVVSGLNAKKVTTPTPYARGQPARKKRVGKHGQQIGTDSTLPTKPAPQSEPAEPSAELTAAELARIRKLMADSPLDSLEARRVLAGDIVEAERAIAGIRKFFAETGRVEREMLRALATLQRNNARNLADLKLIIEPPPKPLDLGEDDPPPVVQTSPPPKPTSAADEDDPYGNDDEDLVKEIES